MIWVPVPKIDVWGIFPTQLLSQNTNFKSELKNVNKHGILKFTLLLIKLEHKVFLDSMFLTKSHNWPQIPTQWWNWVGKMPHKSIFGTGTQIIPNQTSLREKNQ